MSPKNFAWADIFAELKKISELQVNFDTVPEARKRLIHLLENIEKVPPDLHPVIRDSLCNLGYFPYLEQCGEPTLKTEINREFHRSDSLPEIILHKEQFLISELLKSNKSVILSAPTSFGKTLLIEEVVAQRRYDNIVIVEPTLALIDELRTKLKKYEDHYKIIFSKNQKTSERNLFLLTQERLTDYPELPTIDFFVIDEFYKLDVDDDERTDTLNHAFYLLLKKTRNFYLLGPPIGSVPIDFIAKYNCELRINNFETVNVTINSAGERSDQNLFKLLNQLPEQTLIYCAGPDSCESTVKNFVDSGLAPESSDVNNEVIEWIKSNIHNDWSLANLLKHKVAFHHGSLPRHISRNLVEAFNLGHIKYLFCTTTLIEGVNTSAKNVVVFDPRKGKKLLTKFDLRNIAGRAGRMNRYLSGNVYMFIDDPTSDTGHVDFPWFTQEDVSDSLIIQLDEADLKPASAERVNRILQNPHLDLEQLRKNSNVDPTGQIHLAEKLRSEPNLYEKLAWTQYPTWPELLQACNLIWDFLLSTKNVDGVFSGSQLAFFTNRYRMTKVPNALIRDYLTKNPTKTVDQAVSVVMRMIRGWFEFRMPKLIMSLCNIQELVYNSQNRKPGNYKFFASALENGFLPPAVATLRELGIPAELGHKLIRVANIPQDANVDLVIEIIRKRLDRAKFSNYENSLLNRI